MSEQAVAQDHPELADLIEVICQLGEAGLSDVSKWQDHYDARREREMMLALKQEDLEALRLGERDLLRRRCVVLPSRVKDSVRWVPVLWVHIEGDLRFSFQMLVFPEGRCGFGYRWEYPYGNSGGGVHDHCHVQPIWAARRALDATENAVFGKDSVCEHLPTFPIDAIGPLSLVGALLESLYDADAPKKLNNGALYAKLLIGTHRASGAYKAATSRGPKAAADGRKHRASRR